MNRSRWAAIVQDMTGKQMANAARNKWTSFPNIRRHEMFFLNDWKHWLVFSSKLKYALLSSNLMFIKPSYGMVVFSPPARWGLLDFIRAVLLILLLLVLLLLLLLPPPPPRPPPLLPPLPPLPRPLLPCQLLAKLFANFGAQCALLDLNLGHSQLSAHRWTSTCMGPS